MLGVGKRSSKLAKFLGHTYCHRCGSPLKSAEATLLAESSAVSVVHIQCAECGGEILATLNAESYSISDVATGLSPSEVRRFFDAPPVSVDDLLDLHELLQEGKIWQFLERKEEKSWENKSKRSAEKAVCRPSSPIPGKTPFQLP